MDNLKTKKILIVGNENSCHSSMMSALIKHISFDKIKVDCSGLEPAKTKPIVKKVLLEVGIDINKEDPKPLNEFIHTKFDIIITTSEEARKNSESLYSVTKIHKAFDDPDSLTGSLLDVEVGTREIREEMQEWLNEFIIRHRLN
jgi:protein-tyrosine-phosphatase